MSTLAITSSGRSSSTRNAQRSPLRAVVACGVVWYGALLAAAVLPAQSANAAPSPAAQATVNDAAQTSRVPGTCNYFWCR